jgi:hypothetical protein
MPAAAINGIGCSVGSRVSNGYVTTQRGKREFMVIIEGTDKSKRGERERWMAPEVSKPVSTPKIINFEQGRKALEKGALEEEQSRVRLIKSIGLPGGLPYDWSELLLTMAMLFALLLGLYVGLIGS